MMMNWHSLYSAQRSGDAPRDTSANPDAARTSFIRDYDRIIFSSPFRRLQNKTQVFPLPGAVFVHNRLTHSLEVASVGRSLGKAAGDAIADKHGSDNPGFQNFYRYELASVIAAACLAHDIGNPPFGHSGEDAIRTYFTTLEGDTRKVLEEELSPNQLADFRKFEGNAAAFRILTHRYSEPDSSFKLTLATLAAIVKYPCSSMQGFRKGEGISRKKSGFFDGERAMYEGIAATLGIPKTGGDVYARHPFVYLTEAADDICYRVIDLEDAHRLGIVSYAEFESLFLTFFSAGEGYDAESYVRAKLDAMTDENQKVQFIRAKWIGRMIGMVTKLFLEQEDALLAGTFDTALLDAIGGSDADAIRRINRFSVERIYQYRSVLEIEVAGYHIIGGLLNAFVGAVLRPGDSRSDKLLKLIPKQFPITGGSLYEKVLSVVDFISGMTDLYAMDLYRKITGISIPELR